MRETRRWEDLATDCLVSVFAKLDLEDRTLAVPFVCKAWHRASLDPQCWRKLSFRELDFNPWSSFVARFTREYRLGSFSIAGFLKLVLHRSRGAADELSFPNVFLGASIKYLAYASNECRRLRVLALPRMLHPDEKQIPGLIAKWKDLEKLEIGMKPHCFAKIVEEISICCKKLAGLQVSGCITKEDAMTIVNHLPKLRNLVMRECYLSKETVMVILAGCKQLEELDLRKCRGFDPFDGEILMRGSKIKAFELAGAKLQEDYYDAYYAHEDVIWAMLPAAY